MRPRLPRGRIWRSAIWAIWCRCRAPRPTAAAAMTPDYWTVFNDEKASEAGRRPPRTGRDGQLALARIVAAGDTFYRAMRAVLPPTDIIAVAERLDRIDGARFAGITTFPSQLLSIRIRARSGRRPTSRRCAAPPTPWRRPAARTIEINAPGTTSSTVTFEALADAGATQVEPGHGLTGTTPLHALEDLPELPAVVYVSEVSHLHRRRGLLLRRRPLSSIRFSRTIRFEGDRVARADDRRTRRSATVDIPPPAAIDYYGMIDASGRRSRASATPWSLASGRRSSSRAPMSCGISGIRTRVEPTLRSDPRRATAARSTGRHEGLRRQSGQRPPARC